jgi:hypothetical protein
MPLLRRRASTYIHGAGSDTSEPSDHPSGYLASRQSPVFPVLPIQLNSG